MKIRYQLILGFICLVGLGFYYLINWVIDDLRPRYLEAVEEALVDEANILSAMVSESMATDKIQLSEIKRVFPKIYQRKINAKIYKFKKSQFSKAVSCNAGCISFYCYRTASRNWYTAWTNFN